MAPRDDKRLTVSSDAAREINELVTKLQQRLKITDLELLRAILMVETTIVYRMIARERQENQT